LRKRPIELPDEQVNTNGGSDDLVTPSFFCLPVLSILVMQGCQIIRINRYVLLAVKEEAFFEVEREK